MQILTYINKLRDKLHIKYVLDRIFHTRYQRTSIRTSIRSVIRSVIRAYNTRA